jgi:hypothetical protein
MPHFRDKEARGQHNEITVIEDANLVTIDEEGNKRAGFAKIDEYTFRAHPAIMDALLEDAERLWTLEEVLQDIDPSTQTEEVD